MTVHCTVLSLCVYTTVTCVYSNDSRSLHVECFVYGEGGVFLG